ncbi:MAG: hypothetical protein KF721_10395 [Ignavibacteriaceae bacterium]|nr:hypothetical protein [Ignavibacteriaceae bacterium]
MKNGNIFWGILLIVVGLLYLLINVFDVSLNLSGFSDYWPLILILIGLSFLTSNQIVKSVVVGIAAFALAIVIFSFLNSEIFKCDDDFDSDWGESIQFESDIIRSYDSNFKFMDVEISGGAGRIAVTSVDSNLYEVRSKSAKQNILIDTISSNDYYKLKLGLDDNVIDFEDEKPIKRTLDLHLNNKLTYNLSFKLGAAAADLNLKDLNVNKVVVEMGATSLNLELNAPVSDSGFVEIEAGASSINLSSPKDVGVELVNEMKLTSKSLNGFTQIKDNLYRNENFSSAKKKIIIKLNGAVSRVNFRNH